MPVGTWDKKLMQYSKLGGYWVMVQSMLYFYYIGLPLPKRTI